MRTLLLATTLLGGALAAPAHAAEAPALPPEAGPLPAGKLPDTIAPAAYRLDLAVDPAKPRFSGHVEIDAAVSKPSRFVWLHGRGLAVSKVSATVAGRTIAGTFAQVDPTGVALLTFPEALPAGPVTLAFDYDAPFAGGPEGMYHIKVGEDWYGWTQFESIDARAAFPGFDQPGFKTPFTITLRTPAGLKAVSNAPETASETAGGVTIHRFAPTLPLPTYLVAMMTGPFVTAEGAVPPTPQRAAPLPIRVVTTRQNAGQLAFALDGTKGIVQHLEGYFGQSFPFPKLDQITSPVMPGAMENAGADTYADSILVMDDKASTAQKRTFGMVVAHELAHQWFGDLVTPAWWDDIWLNESFANWMGFRIGNEWRPDLNIAAGALAEGFGAMNTDSLGAGRPIHQPITANGQIDAAFDSITYGKGGHVIAMIAAFMGDEKFRDGVRRHMAAHRYGNATSADFFRAMADAAGDPRILAAMQSFTDQQGVPLVTFARAPGGGWSLTQSRYARLGSTLPGTRWGIPLCVRQGAARNCALMTGETMALSIGGAGPLVPNAGGTGYYRFELPRADWDALIAAAPGLPAGEGLAVEDSLAASFVAGRARAAQLIAGTRTLARNPDSYVSGVAPAMLVSLADRGVIAPGAAPAYRRLIAELAAPLLAPLGFDPRAGAYAAEEPDRAQRRAQLVALLVEQAKDPALTTELAAAAQRWLDGDTAALDSAYFGPGFRMWLAQRQAAGQGLAAAKLLADRALASEDPLFRPFALGAVAQTGDVGVARWALDELNDKRLRLSERRALLVEVLGTAGTREFGYDWMARHLDELLNGEGGIFFGARLPGALSDFCGADRAAQFAALRPRFAGKPGALELERTIERVRNCGVLKAVRGRELAAALATVK